MKLKGYVFLLALAVGCAHPIAGSVPDLTQTPRCGAGSAVGNPLDLRMVPGDTLCLRARTEAGDIVSLAAVGDAADANIVLRSWRDGPSDVFLAIENDLPDPLEPEMFMRVPDRRSPIPTSSCTVTKLGIEHWPHPMLEFRFASFSLVAQDENLACY